LAIVLVLLWAAPSDAQAKRLQKEREYQQAWCNERGGVTEFRLDDGTRVDCVTKQYAVEFDFADKWAESVGQAIYYAVRLGLTPGVVLIFESDKACRYLDRFMWVKDQVIVISDDKMRIINLWAIGNAKCVDSDGG